ARHGQPASRGTYSPFRVSSRALRHPGRLNLCFRALSVAPRQSHTRVRRHRRRSGRIRISLTELLLSRDCADRTPKAPVRFEGNDTLLIGRVLTRIHDAAVKELESLRARSVREVLRRDEGFHDLSSARNGRSKDVLRRVGRWLFFGSIREVAEGKRSGDEL